MLSKELTEAVMGRYVDLEAVPFMDVYKGVGLEKEEMAVAQAILKSGQAFIRDPKNAADEDGVRHLVYRGLRRIGGSIGAIFGEFLTRRGRPIYPNAKLDRNIKLQKVKGRTGEGWKVTANLEMASASIATYSLEQVLKRMPLPRRQGDTETRQANASEFTLMQPFPVKASGWQGSGWYWQFKHRDTRNYVFLNVERGTLYIPTTPKPFMRGEFG